MLIHQQTNGRVTPAVFIKPGRKRAVNREF
jgi:hypothetical protein